MLNAGKRGSDRKNGRSGGRGGGGGGRGGGIAAAAKMLFPSERKKLLKNQDF